MESSTSSSSSSMMIVVEEEERKQQQQQEIKIEESRLVDDVNSLTRVRNRLAAASDHQLPKILSGLLPKLLVRLEGYSPIIALQQQKQQQPSSNNNNNNNDNDNDEVISDEKKEIKELRLKAKSIIWGILDHALERLKGNSDIDINDIMIALLPFITSTNCVVGTWALAFQQRFVQQIINHDTIMNVKKKNNESSSSSPSSLSVLPTPSLMGQLITCIDQVRQEQYTMLEQEEEPNNINTATSNKKNNQRRMTNASWLLFDCIMIRSGLSPMIDWEKDIFDGKEARARVEQNSLDAWHDHPIAPIEAITAANVDGSGMFHLLLDLLLFWPTSSLSTCGISTGSDDLLRDRSTIPQEEQTTIVGGGRRRTRTIIRHKWTEMTLLYLRHLKLCALQFAIWPINRSLLCNDNNASDRALILSILFNSSDSMHGRLAADYLRHGFEYTSVRNNHDNDRNLQQKRQRSTNNNKTNFQTLSLSISDGSGRRRPCSLSVAVSLLILIVGDRRARPALETYREAASKSSSNHENVAFAEELWEKILGPLPTSPAMQRPRLPLPVTARAVDFLLQRPLESVVREEQKREAAKATPTTIAIARLIIDLTLLLSHSSPGENDTRDDDEIKQGKYWAILLIKHFYSQLTASSRIHNNDDEWTMGVFEKCLDACEEVLSVVVELGESKMRRRRTPDGQLMLPLGVHVPFNNRNDLNNLLHTHRENQKRNNLQMDEALQGRQIAYELTTTLKQNALRRETKPFELAIFLFKCMVHENPQLQQSVATALEALLDGYTTKSLDVHADDPDPMTGSRERAVPLLSCLLDAILLDSDIARNTAVQWIKELLWHMDAEAACHLASYLVDDMDRKVADTAKSVLAMSTHNNASSKKDVDMKIEFFDFIDPNTDDGREILQRELGFRVQRVSTGLGVPVEYAAIILYDFKFSVDEFQRTFNNRTNSSAIMMKNSGLPAFQLPASILPNETRTSPPTINQERFCGICYEEVNELNSKSLECGHEFCISCWKSYLETSSSELVLKFLNTRCPEHKCNMRLRSDHLQVIAPPNISSKWNEAYIDAFIELDPSYRFCPGVDCTLVATVPLSDQRCQSVTCERCETTFCFQCGGEPHQPATCNDYLEFNKLMSSSTLWIRKNAKPCPGCHSPIEKNDGCNHMTCGKCEQEFCWLCLAKLTHHSEDRACNRYDPAENAEDDFERHALFVSDRYQAHDDSMKFAGQNLKKSLERPEKLVEMFWFLGSNDEQILQSGFETVVRARMVLKNSYIASFGLRQDPQKMKSLESHQGALEMFTERLSQLTEQNLHSLLAEKGQAKLIQHFQGLAFYTVSVSRYMSRFLDICADLNARKGNGGDNPAGQSSKHRAI